MLSDDGRFATGAHALTGSNVLPLRKADDAEVRGREVIRLEAEALLLLEKSIDASFGDACRLVYGTERQLILTGMGKSGHVARKIAATFAATGTPATYVHPIEAGHGDLGTLAQGDVLMVLSNSGNTPELRAILNHARKLGIPVIGVATHKNSLVIGMADVGLLLPRVREACSANIAPTTSTAMQLALGDALAMAVMDLRGVTRDDLHALHPAGAIGLALTPVGDLMLGPDRMPLVHREVGMSEAISAMTTGCFGVVGVTDDAGHLAGIITDGDLRRRFDQLQTAFAHEVMTSHPKVIPADMPAGEVLAFLNGNAITAAFVVEDPDEPCLNPIGIIHIHELLRHGLS